MIFENEQAYIAMELTKAWINGNRGISVVDVIDGFNRIYGEIGKNRKKANELINEEILRTINEKREIKEEE